MLNEFLQQEQARFHEEFWKLSGEFPGDLERKQNDWLIASYERILQKVREIVEKEKTHWEKHSAGNYKDGAIEALDDLLSSLGE